MIAFGLAFLMVTTPNLFQHLARWSVGNGFTRATFGFLNETAVGWKSVLRRGDITEWVGLGLSGVLLAVPVLLAAATIRSTLVRMWHPLGITAMALGLGVISIPAITWLGELAVLLFRVIAIVYDAIIRFFTWIAPVLAVLLLVVAGLAVLAGVVMLIAYIHERKWWLNVALAAAIAGGLYYAIEQGWLSAFFEWLAMVAHVIAVWIAKYLGPIVAWLVRAVIFVVIALVLAGGFCAGFGQVGRTLWLPLKSATTAGRDQAKCADAAAGIGVSLSLLLTAATTNVGFGADFVSVWHSTPGVSSLPAPVAAFDFLLRDKSESILAKGFEDFNPAPDVLLLLVICAVAIVSLLLQPRRWTSGEGSKVAVPVMVGLGIALAIALPLLLLSIFSSDSG